MTKAKKKSKRRSGTFAKKKAKRRVSRRIAPRDQLREDFLALDPFLSTMGFFRAECQGSCKGAGVVLLYLREFLGDGRWEDLPEETRNRIARVMDVLAEENDDELSEQAKSTADGTCRRLGGANCYCTAGSFKRISGFYLRRRETPDGIVQEPIYYSGWSYAGGNCARAELY